MYLFVGKVRLNSFRMVNFYLFKDSFYFFWFAVRRSDYLFVQTLDRGYNCVFDEFFRLVRLWRDFNTWRTYFNRVIFWRGNFYRINGNRRIVVRARRDFSWRRVNGYVAFLCLGDFTYHDLRYLVIFLRVTCINCDGVYANRFKFGFRRTVRCFANFIRFNELCMRLTRMSRYFRIFLSDGNFNRTFCNVIQSTRALDARSIVFRCLGILLYDFLLFTFQTFKLSQGREFGRIQRSL